MKNLTIPTVHLNGTSAEDLIQQYRKAYRATQDALKALAESAPHGRDYYVQSDGAFEKARKEHESRAERLRAVSDELLELALQVQDQAWGIRSS